MTGSSNRSPDVTKRPARIMIVDDHPIVREGLAALLAGHRDLTVSAQVEDIAGAMKQIETNPPDIAVIDIALKNESGLDLIRRIHDRNKSVRMLAVSMHDENLYGERVLDEAEIPDWVYRRFPSKGDEGKTSATSDQSGTARHTVTRAAQAQALEPAISDLVHVALMKTGYPLDHLRCWNDDDTLTLSGFVTRYFYAQIALETALRLANGRRIEAHIDVLPAPDRDEWDD